MIEEERRVIDPLSAAREMPPAEPVPAVQMTAFAAARDRALARLAVPAILRASAK